LEINSIETSIQDEPNSSKLLDVWEDANLLKFLKQAYTFQVLVNDKLNVYTELLHIKNFIIINFILHTIQN
jgi:hypothetical protein